MSVCVLIINFFTVLYIIILCQQGVQALDEENCNDSSYLLDFFFSFFRADAVCLTLKCKHQ